MQRATATFKRLVTTSDALERNRGLIRSTVYFDLQIAGRKFTDIRVDVKQTIRKLFVDSPIKVSSPVACDGPIDHPALSRAVEAYYRHYFAPEHRAAAAQASLNTTVVHTRVTATFEVSPKPAG